jgi:mxaD protein
MRRADLFPVAAFLLALIGGGASAGEQSVKKTLSLPGSPAATWAVIADYCAIQKWHPAIATCEIIKGTANQLGAVRLLTLQDGGKVSEELVGYDAKKRSYTYKILESPLPISGYTATIAVGPGSSGGSVIDWHSTFDAAPGTDPAAARATIEGIYDAGLARLKEMGAAK